MTHTLLTLLSSVVQSVYPIPAFLIQHSCPFRATLTHPHCIRSLERSAPPSLHSLEHCGAYMNYALHMISMSLYVDQTPSICGIWPMYILSLGSVPAPGDYITRSNQDIFVSRDSTKRNHDSEVPRHYRTLKLPLGLLVLCCEVRPWYSCHDQRMALT
jgi:hypothetical protein